MRIGDINIYRTVGRTKRGLAWRYVGEDAGGEPLFEGDHFWEVSVHAVNEEVARVNRAKREGVI